MRDGRRRVEGALEIPILIAALLVIPVIVIEQSSWGEPWKTLAAVLNWAISTAFLVEFVALLLVTPDRWRWLRRHPLEVAIVVLTPPFLPASLQAARVFRLLRLIRLLRLVQLLRRLYSTEGLKYAAVVAALTALGGGAAFAGAEDHSTWIGVYWAVTTMTTVGYGDVTPDTNLGRGIAILVMLVGIGFLTLVIGAIAQRFLETAVEEVREFEAEIAAESVDEILSELRATTERLRALEGRVQRLRANA